MINKNKQQGFTILTPSFIGGVFLFEKKLLSLSMKRISRKNVTMKKRIYLDDVRTPIEKNEWVIVRSYDEFVEKINEIGLENISLISLDHDLGDTAMAEWHRNVYHNYTLDYDNITEKTGMDCTKWLVEQWMDGKPVVNVVVHSANAIGSANMMGYINNYRHVNRLPQDCVRVQIEHTV